MTDWFKEASSFYLTIPLSREEFKKLKNTHNFPVSEGYEYWGVEVLKEHIEVLESYLKTLKGSK